MSELPTGTVTFVFTDIEGSTMMLQRLGDAFVEVLEDHNRIIRTAFDAGTEVRSEGDAFFFAFSSAPGALRAAVDAQRELAAFSWPDGGTVRVRIGMHTGEGLPGGDDYVGLDVHRAARIAAAGHGGQILLSDATKVLAASTLSADVSLLDLGDHRFKDLEEHEHVHQAVIRGLAADFPPIKSLDAAPNNLPAQLTVFVGRDREVREVTDMLQSSRLVTLTGPGGTGKTRLAVHVASSLVAQFPDGVVYVPLDSLRDADLVIPAIADRLGLGDKGTDSPLEAIATRLASATTLLLLDNFEHVLDASSGIATLLAQTTGVTVLVTSQSPLRIRGEQIYAVPPLASDEAVELFAQLVTASDHSFQVTEENRDTVVDVVTRLEGMPLALELTAPRVQLFGLAGLRDRLIERLDVTEPGFADVPEWHRTLNSAISWSYALLTAEEQALLRQLSIFDGGFTLESAEAVVSPHPATGVVEGVASLMDKSILRHHVHRGEARFSMLESIRQFSLEALIEAGEHADAAQRHGQYFAQLAETAREILEGEGQQVWLDRLAAENDNILAVLRLSRDTKQPDLGLRAAGSAWRFFERRGHLPEAREWLELLLDLPGASPQARAEGIDGLACIVFRQSDFAEAERLYTELLDLFRTLGDGLRVADTLFALSALASLGGDYERGTALADEARAAYEDAGSDYGARRVMIALALAARRSGRLEEALELYKDAHAEYEAVGDRAGTLLTALGVAAVAYQLGHTDDAVTGLAEALALVTIDDVSGAITALDFLAALTAAANPERSVRLAGAVHRYRAEEGGGLGFTPEVVGLESARSVAAPTMDETAIEAAWAEGAAMSLEEALEFGREVVSAALAAVNTASPS